MSIRKGDLVMVIAGDDQDKKPHKVLRMIPSKGKLVVEGVNRTYKHVRPGKNSQGGRLSIELPVDCSNVLLFCGTCKKGVRTKISYTPEGVKLLVCKSCLKAGRAGVLRVVAKADPKYATK
ncbi:MAG: 50S ribosomal protein L24 [Planctomycetota bacterium]|nr:50S ribosomal protein L24 [Planctomycetota bacterium]RLS37851.1 MAG: 50S ribosomal protein L24 [Planctomycetota bacterium]